MKQSPLVQALPEMADRFGRSVEQSARQRYRLFQMGVRMASNCSIFRFVRKPNTKSGGRSGSTLVKNEPFLCEACTNLERINTVAGGTRYGINKKYSKILQDI